MKKDMDKPTAEKIIQLGIQESQIMNEKWAVMQDFGTTSWDQITTLAMKFLLEKLNAHV